MPSLAPRPRRALPVLSSHDLAALTASFVGARLPVCDSDVLVVVVTPSIMADPHNSQLLVRAFRYRYPACTPVLMAQAVDLAPTYFGPANIVHVLARLRVEAIPWQRFCDRPPPRYWWLPTPRDPPPTDTTAAPSSSLPSSPPVPLAGPAGARRTLALTRR